jgi:hypothetical protein
VCLAKPDSAFQQNVPMMNKPKLWPVLMPWQNNLNRDQMFGGYEVVVKRNEDGHYAVKKIKGYSKLLHLMKGVTSTQFGQLPGTIKMLHQLCEKITEATNNNTFAACNFCHEISISIEMSDLVSSTVLFDQAIKKAYNCHHCVQILGILYNQVPLKPRLAMTMLIYRKNKVDVFGTRNSNVPTQNQFFQYSCMVSLLGVASKYLNKYLFFLKVVSSDLIWWKRLFLHFDQIQASHAHPGYLRW